MAIQIEAGILSGNVPAVSSKSDVHRALICAAFSERPSKIGCNVLSKDILATKNCLCALGAGIVYEEAAQVFSVVPAEGAIRRGSGTCGTFCRGEEKVTAEETALPDEWNNPDTGRSLFCEESGSTLRFLLPVAASLGIKAEFTGSGRLPERPLDVLTGELRRHGAAVSRDCLPLTVKGPLSGGCFRLPGNISSQFISGLLLCFPLLREDAELSLTTELESAAYVDMTIDTMRHFGAEIEVSEAGGIRTYRYRAEGQERSGYRAPEFYASDGDWSNAAFWLCADRIGRNRIRVEGLREDSLQGDRRITKVLPLLEQEVRTIDASGIPDLIPVLAALCAVTPGKTEIVHAGRLRLKECDRLSAMAENLKCAGADVTEQEEGLTIYGKETLCGGVRVKGFNDHRIVMSMAVLAGACREPVIITDEEAVAKSYPHFFADFRKLGGRCHVI